MYIYIYIYMYTCRLSVAAHRCTRPRGDGPGLKEPSCGASTCSKVYGLWCRGVGFRVYGAGCPGCKISDFALWVSDFGFRVSSSRFRIFRFRVSCSGFQVSGFSFREGCGLRAEG